MCTRSLGRTLNSIGLKIKQSPSDGHCLLHSIQTSCVSQLSLNDHKDLDVIKAQNFLETITNASEYTPFLPSSSVTEIITGLRSYLIDKNCNQSFGDLIPAILANALKVKLEFVMKIHTETFIETSMFLPVLVFW